MLRNLKLFYRAHSCKLILIGSYFVIPSGPTAVVMKSPRISLECGVCDSVCFSRLTKQTLKFEAVCCELCRKFITRMMVRARSSENSVPCDNGQGKKIK